MRRTERGADAPVCVPLLGQRSGDNTAIQLGAAICVPAVFPLSAEPGDGVLHQYDTACRSSIGGQTDGETGGVSLSRECIS